jgi:hypothetical protein
LIEELRVSEEDGDAGIFEHEGEAFDGIGRVEREVGGTGFEDGEGGDEEIETALQAEGDRRFAGEAEGEEMMSELISARVEMSIGEGEAVEEGSDGIGSAADLLLEEVVDAFLARIVACGLVEFK